MFMSLVGARLGGLLGNSPFWAVGKSYLQSFLILSLCIFGLSYQSVLAQSSLQQKTEFSREVNQFRWKSDTDWNAQLSQWKIDMTNRFVSDAYIQFDQRLRFRDEDRFSFSMLRPLTRRFDATIQGGIDWFGAGRASSQTLLFGTQFTPVSRFRLQAASGIASDRRPGIVQGGDRMPLRIDTGPAAAVSATFAPDEIQGYEVSFQSNAFWRYITPRRIGDVAVRGNAARTFGRARFETRARFSSRRRDTYQAASFLNRGLRRDPESIEATTSDTLHANILIQTPLMRGLRMISQADIQLNQRRVRSARAPLESINFETNFARQALTGEVSLFYENDRVNAQLSAEYEAVSERRVLTNQEDLPASEISQKRTLLQQADYDEGVFALRGTLRSDLLARLSILFTGSSRIVRHDTPIVNLDDRDEIYHTGSLSFLHQRSRHLSMRLQLFGSYHHTVFLNAERSAENNIQRTLRLRPSMEWNPSSSSRIRLASEVRATYTTDDFALPGRRSSDQSAREFRIESEFDQRVISNTDLLITARYSDLRLAQLIWQNFTEVPFDTLRTLSTWVRIQSGRQLRGEIGWRIFLRSDFDRAVSVVYQLPTDRPITTLGRITRPGKRWVIQTGPSGAMYWTKGNTTLSLNVWANWQRLRYSLYGTLPSMNQEIIQRAARKGTRRLIPLISLSLMWEI